MSWFFEDFIKDIALKIKQIYCRHIERSLKKKKNGSKFWSFSKSTINNLSDSKYMGSDCNEDIQYIYIYIYIYES